MSEISAKQLELIEAVRTRLGSLLDSAPADGEAVAINPETAQNLSAARLAIYIDHTLLKPEATTAMIDKLCDEAREFRMASVCVNPIHVARCVERLEGSGVMVATVVGFPLGAMTPETKAFEARQLSGMGAAELDMVLNIGALKDDNFALVKDDVAAVVAAGGGAAVKVIIESGGLNEEEIIEACLLSKAAGAAFVKTSTGFLFSGATAETIALMRAAVGPSLGVKASGGVRDVDAARAMLAHGATRLGTSSGVAIVTGGGGTTGY
jgi:deoxyribose-phosphate aldolase